MCRSWSWGYSHMKRHTVRQHKVKLKNMHSLPDRWLSCKLHVFSTVTLKCHTRHLQKHMQCRYRSAAGLLTAYFALKMVILRHVAE